MNILITIRIKNSYYCCFNYLYIFINQIDYNLNLFLHIFKRWFYLVIGISFLSGCIFGCFIELRVAIVFRESVLGVVGLVVLCSEPIIVYLTCSASDGFVGNCGSVEFVGIGD
jgi:hypothetical protein